MKALFSLFAILLTTQVSSMTFDDEVLFEDPRAGYVDLEASHHHSSSGSSCSSSSKPKGNNNCKCRVCPMGPPGPQGAAGSTGATGATGIDVISSFGNFGSTAVQTIATGSAFSTFSSTYVNNNTALLTISTPQTLAINQTGFFSVDYGICALAPTGASAADFSTSIALAIAVPPSFTGAVQPQSAIAAHATMLGESTTSGSCIIQVGTTGTLLSLFNIGPNSITVGGTGAALTQTSFLTIEKISN